jgi:hypothetical protein
MARKGVDTSPFLEMGLLPSHLIGLEASGKLRIKTLCGFRRRMERNLF